MPIGLFAFSNHLTHSTHFTHLRKRFATQIIRGAAKARFCRTLRAGLADARTAPYRKFGFTLAEVLITLGVIGIVAAMTIPTLVTNYQKKVTETKLRRFYATMTNAIKLEEAEIGSITTWLPDGANGETFEQWYNDHLDKHIKSLSKSDLGSVEDGVSSPNPNFLVGLVDGSGFVGVNTEFPTGHGNYAHFFYCTELKECGVNKMDGKKSFLFSIIEDGTFVPSVIKSQSKTREELLESCKYGNYDNPEVSTPDKRHDCALLIMRDGWEIKADYPWEQVILPQK